MSAEVENIKAELKQLGCNYLIELQIVNPYKTPDFSYFVHNLSYIEEKGQLLTYAKDNLYEVPTNYFRDLVDSIDDIVLPNKRLAQTEFFQLSFENEKISMPFALPEGYFEQLRPEFLDKEEKIFRKKDRVKLVSLFQHLNKYVVAAVILVLFSLGANIMLRIKEEKKALNMLNNMDINNELADVPTEEIFNYLNSSSSKNMEYLINPNGSNIINKVMSSDSSINYKNNIKETQDNEILQFLSDEDHGF